MFARRRRRWWKATLVKCVSRKREFMHIYFLVPLKEREFVCRDKKKERREVILDFLIIMGVGGEWISDRGHKKCKSSSPRTIINRFDYHFFFIAPLAFTGIRHFFWINLNSGARRDVMRDLHFIQTARFFLFKKNQKCIIGSLTEEPFFGQCLSIPHTSHPFNSNLSCFWPPNHEHNNNR